MKCFFFFFFLLFFKCAFEMFILSLCRLSVFLVGLQSVVRTISLVFPFKKIKRATVIFTILLFLVIYSIYALIPYFWATKRFYFKGLSTCTYSPYQFLWGLMKKDPRLKRTSFIYYHYSRTSSKSTQKWGLDP